MNSAEFLHYVWSQQPHNAGYVFVSTKIQGKWRDTALRWPISNLGGLQRLIETRQKRGDVYFCPTIFNDKRRLEVAALSSVWLHADLDEVDPSRHVDPVLPATSAWMTSRGRYQCLWQVEQVLGGGVHAKLNKALTYLLGADKGGWSITKALRVPGTVNHKRERKDVVSLLWAQQQEYSARTVLRVVKDVKLRDHAKIVRDLELPNKTAQQLFREHKLRLNKRAQKLLKATTGRVGERSERLWELECLLVEAGIPLEECLILVRGTVWNKYSGTGRELSQLWTELNKASEQVSEADRERAHTRVNGHVAEDAPWVKAQLQHYSKFMAVPVQNKLWAVEGIWSDSAHGFIAGEPKTFKSFIATDLAVSVASGTKFLGHFPVPEEGPVILIQEENTPGMMKDRLEKILTSRSLTGSVNGHQIVMPPKLPIHLMNNQGLDLTNDSCLEWLEDQIRKLKPKLLVLDPLYMMIPGVDESSQKDLTPVLRSLLNLKQEQGCGILIVHHYNKPRENDDRHPGNRLSGSGVLYRWFESVIYLDKMKGQGEVKMTTEHRSHAPAGGLKLQFDIGDMGTTDYFVDVELQGEAGVTTRTQLKELVADAGRKGISSAEAAELLGCRPDHVLTLARRMKMRVKPGPKTGKPGRPPMMVFSRSAGM